MKKQTALIEKKAPQQYPRAAASQIGRDGQVLSAISEKAWTAFMAVPAEAATGVAQAIADQSALVGTSALQDDERKGLAAQVDDQALALTSDVAKALGRDVPEVISATSVNPEMLRRGQAQVIELERLDKTIGVAQGRVDGCKLVLGTLQFEACAIVAADLIAQLGDESQPEDERTRLMLDSNEIWTVEEKRFSTFQVIQRQRAASVTAIEAETDETRQEALLLRTMRDLRDRKPVPAAVMKTIAPLYMKYLEASATETDPAAKPARKQKRA